MDPVTASVIGAGATALVAGGGHLLSRRSNKDATKVEGFRASMERLDKVEERLDSVEHERRLDQAWITNLRDHIVRQLPPPPPNRPTSL